MHALHPNDREIYEAYQCFSRHLLILNQLHLFLWLLEEVLQMLVRHAEKDFLSSLLCFIIIIRIIIITTIVIINLLPIVVGHDVWVPVLVEPTLAELLLGFGFHANHLGSLVLCLWEVTVSRSLELSIDCSDSSEYPSESY